MLNYLLGFTLSILGAYGLFKNKQKFEREIRKDGISFLAYLIDGFLFGTSALFLSLVVLGLAFVLGYIKIQ